MKNFKIENFKIFDQKGRSVNHIYRSAECDILIVCWEPFQESSYHDHGQSESVVYVVEGTLKVSSEGRENIYSTGDIIVTPVGIKHKMTNIANVRLVTYHVYAPALKTPISDPYRIFFQTIANETP